MNPWRRCTLDQTVPIKLSMGMASSPYAKYVSFNVLFAFSGLPGNIPNLLTIDC